MSTTIDYHSAEARIELLMGIAVYLRLSDAQARAVVAEVGLATTGWREKARELGLGEIEIERMTPAFEHEQAREARALATVPTREVHEK